MSDVRFEALLTHALVQAIEQTWLDQTPEEELRGIFPRARSLDKRIKSIGRTVVKRLDKSVFQYLAVFALAVSLTFGVLMLHPKTRLYIIDLGAFAGVDRVAHSIEEDAPGRLPENWIFGYVPDGFILSEEEKGASFHSLLFHNEEQAFLRIAICTDTSDRFMDHVDDAAGRGSPQNQRGEYYGADEKLPNQIVWYREDLGLLIEITGDLSIDELILVMENMSLLEE